MKINKYEVVKKIKRKMKNVYLFNTTVSVYLLFILFYKKLINFDVDQRAAAVSFSFILAVFPSTLFLFTLIPYIPIEGFQGLILEFLKNLMPDELYKSVQTTILEIISKPRVDILSFGFLFAVYAATNGMMSLMRSFNMALKQKEKRSFLKARGIALGLTSLLITIMFVSTTILIAGKIALTFFTEQGLITEGLDIIGVQLIGYFSVFIIFYIGICSIYYFAPAIHQKLRFFNIGALFASILCIIITNLFSYYLENFNSYNKLYGSIGTLIAIMVWIYFNILTLILGFELNIAIRTALAKESEKTP